MKLSKWQALGNDYLLVEQAELTRPLTPDRVRELCDYHYGVGSDGLLEIMSTNGTRAEIRIWNPDGSTAELSGNGVRIVAAWLARHEDEPLALAAGFRFWLRFGRFLDFFLAFVFASHATKHDTKGFGRERLNADYRCLIWCPIPRLRRAIWAQHLNRCCSE